MAWGDLVHQLLEDAATTGRMDRQRLERLATRLTVGKAALQPVIAEALDTVDQVTTTDMWRRAMAADERHTEVPFSYAVDAGVGVTPVQHGVIDLVYRKGDAWEIVDYKTDQVTDGEVLLAQYRDQLVAYVTAWAHVVTVRGLVRAGVHAVRLGSTHWLDNEPPR